LYIGTNDTPSGLVALRGGGRMVFRAMSRAYRGEGFGGADNHDLSIPVDPRAMDVPGGSQGCAGGNGAFEGRGTER
jgi:hypothetical protein